MDCGDLSLEVVGVFVLFVSVEWPNCRVVSEGRRVRDVCGFLSHGLQTRRPCVALNIILMRADVLADLLTGVRAGVLTGVLAISFLAGVLTDVLADLLTRVLADVAAGGVVRKMTCSGNRRGPYVVGFPRRELLQEPSAQLIR